MKILVDMALSPKFAEALCSGGFEARHWSELGAANAPDTEIFARARTEGWTILTCDLDFSTLLAQARTGHPSVIQLRLPRITLGNAWEVTLSSLSRYQHEIEDGCLITIDAAKTRIRILPLR